MSTSLRIAILGAGSSYGAVLLTHLRSLLAHTPLELAVHDLDPDGAQRAGELASCLVPQASLRIAQDARGCLDGADLVIHLYRAGPPDYRLQQELAARELGLVGQETQGFGGAASAMCNIAALRRIAADAIAVCPDALHLFITNPTGVMTAAADELNLQAVGLCELPFVMQRACEQVCGVGTRIDYVGLNHFAWIVGGHRADGSDCGRTLLASAHEILRISRPPNIPLAVPERVVELFDAIPSPYLAYYYATQAALELQMAREPRARQVARINRELDGILARGELAAALELSRSRGGHMLGEATRAFVLAWIGAEPGELILCSTAGSGNRPRVAREQSILVSRGRLEPRPPIAALHPHLAAMLNTMEAYERLLVRAGLDEDLDVFEQALLTHPLVRDAAAARKLTQAHADQATPQRL